MTSYSSQISSLERQVADLRRNDAQEAKKEADVMSKQARALDSANRASNPSQKIIKIKEAERAGHDLAGVQKIRADISKKLADKSEDLRSYIGRQSKEDAAAFKKAETAQKRYAIQQKQLIKEREDHERRARTDIRIRSQVSSISDSVQNVAFDFFIVHASEDKDEIVRSLAAELKQRSASVFYDETSLVVGDSLRRKIDEGLSASRFGVVVLSANFFSKAWPAKELDGLVALEVAGRSGILPIWHKVSKDEVTNYSPTLADKVALNTSLKSTSEIADELMKLLKK